MHYTTKTIDRTIVGPYTGKRIAGTSEQMFDAVVTIEYHFDGFTILVSGIPIHWDEERQRQYISGKVGIEMNRRVREIAVMLQRQRGNAAALEQVSERQEEQQDAYERMARMLVQCASVRISFEAPVPMKTAA